MGGVKIQAPRGCGVGRGVLLPTGGGAVPPPQKNFAFFASNITRL